MTMKALTVRQPYAWAIAYGGKTIENRSRATRHRGLLAIHAGAAWHEDGALDQRVIDAVRADTTVDGRHDPPLHVVSNESRTEVVELCRTDQRYVFGAVIAVVDLLGSHGSHACVRTAHLGELHPDGLYECSRWAVGGGGGVSHWELANVRPLAQPVPCKGALGLWDLPADMEALVRDQLAGDGVGS